MTHVAGGIRTLDLFHYVHTRYNLAEYAVTPSVLAGIIQEIVVRHVDEELGGGGMGVRGARHGEGAVEIAQPIFGLVLDGVAGLLLSHTREEASTLDHEVTNHPVEDSAVEKAVLYILEKILASNGCVFLVQFYDDIAVVGLECDHGMRVSYCFLPIRVTLSKTTGFSGTFFMPRRVTV